MSEDITSAVTGILSGVGSLLTPTSIGSGDSLTASGYTWLLALVAFAAVFTVSRSILKKLRRK